MAVTGGVVERFSSGHPKITYTVGAAVTAARLVELTGNRTIGPAGAGSFKVCGVAMQSADAVNDKVMVMSGGVVNLRAGGAIAAGDYLISGALGVVVAAGIAPDARTVIGQALEAIVNGNDGPVRLLL